MPLANQRRVVPSVVPLYTFVFTLVTSGVNPMHVFMAKSRVPKSRLKSVDDDEDDDDEYFSYIYNIYKQLVSLFHKYFQLKHFVNNTSNLKMSLKSRTIFVLLILGYS